MWEWKPGSGCSHEWALHGSPAAETGWAPREGDAGGERKGVLHSPEGCLGSAKGPQVCALMGPSGLQASWNMQGAVERHQQEVQPIEVHTRQKATSVTSSGTLKPGCTWAQA